MNRPSHLNNANAEAFLDAEVARLYCNRPPYPDDAIRFLATLATDKPRRVLDLGAGTGFIARPLAPLVESVDALDPSAAMIAEGRNQPGGESDRIRWIVGSAEDAALDGSYSLIVVAEALHWMDWQIVPGRCSGLLTEKGSLAITGVDMLPTAWDGEIRDVIARHSVVKDYTPFDLIGTLEGEGLLRIDGRYESAVQPFEQTVDEYIDSFHARSSLARSRMGEESARLFDREIARIVGRHCGERVVRSIKATVSYGRPLSRN